MVCWIICKIKQFFGIYAVKWVVNIVLNINANGLKSQIIVAIGDDINQNSLNYKVYHSMPF